MEAVARQLLESARRIAAERFELRAVTPLMHPHAPWRDYDAMRQVMEKLGFRLLGDFELVGQPAYVLRILVSHDGVVTATFYQTAPRWPFGGLLARLGGGRGILDLETAFTDGVTLETSTERLADPWQSPPFLVREHQPKMDPAALLARHLRRIAEQTERNPAAQPHRVGGIEQVVAIGRATAERKRQFRQSIGWITRDELAAHAGKLPPAQIDRIHAEIRRLVETETAAEPSPPPPVWTPPPPPHPSPRPIFQADAPPQAPPRSTAPAPAKPPASAEPAAPPPFAGASADRLSAADAAAGSSPGPAAEDGRNVAASTPDASGEAATRDRSRPEEAGAPADQAVRPGERTLDQLVGRALVMNALIYLHFRAPVEIVRRWIEANGAAQHLSPRERALLAKPNAGVTPEERAGLRGYIEALWALLWAGGVADGLAPGQPVPSHMATLVPNLKTNEDASQLRGRMRLRPADELARMRGRYERVHASFRDGASLPGVRPEVVERRRKALEWLMEPARGWDDPDA